jgi:hypothetical protein
VTAYVDSSALVKLIVEEAGSPTLRPFLDAFPILASSRIATVEVTRAAGRHLAPAMDRASEVLDSLLLVELDAAVADRAERIAPDTLRSLDAIHLASAMALAEDVEVFVTYDERLAAAARALGMHVASPA